jgi:hypothetical protein
MATQADVRRIALSMAGAEEASDRFAFSVPGKPKPSRAWRCSMPAPRRRGSR